MLGLRINRWAHTAPGGSAPAVAYYVDAVFGSDANDGLTPATAVKTISRVNSLDLSGAIRKVLFKRGQTWEGTITVPNSGEITNPVVYGAYGTGAKPKILGSELITGWTLHDGNIWKATFATAINQLFVEDQRMQVARWPESGFANVDVANSTSSLTCNALNDALNYTGVKCLIHSSSYGLETKNVTSSTGKTLTLASAPFGDVSLNEKFILVGKLEFLTKAGQWFYDPATQTVYLWKPDGSQPTDTEVRGSTRDYGFSATSKNFWQVTNIEFAQQKTSSINLSGCSNYNINNTTTTDPDSKGINDLNCESGVYYKNTVTGSNHTGITSELSDNMRFEANTVTNIALFENLGLSGIGVWYGGSGIATHGDNNQIIYNRVDETGYNGISFHGLHTCNWNHVTNFCRTKNDGAAIYTSAPVTDPDYAYGSEQNKGSVVRYNTCEYGWGVNTGAGAYAEGIYLDESSGGVIVEYNTVSYCSGRGIFNHKGNSHIQRYNTVFLCENGLYISRVGDDIQMTDNVVYGGTNQELAHLNTITGTPVVNNNKYINHYYSTPFQIDWGTHYNLTDWRTTTGQDADSTLDSTALSAGHTEKLLTNPTATAKRYYLNNASQVINDVTKDEISGTYIDVPAWGSIIVTGLNVDCILDYADSVAPVLTAFEMASNSSQATVSPVSFGATGNPTKYILTESSVTPELTDAGWFETPSYTFSTEGVKTLYLWARDAAGNISESMSANISIEESVFDDVVLWGECDAAGTVFVDKTGTNTGTNKNASDADYSATPVAGKLGDAYSYSGATFRYSTIPNSESLDFSKAFTIAAWVKPTTLSSARGVFGKRDGTYSEWELYINADGSVSFTLIENGNNVNRITCKTATGVVTAANWHLIALRHDGTNRKAGFSLYVNNVLQSVTYTYSGTVTSELSTGIIHTSAPLKIATALAGAANMTGLIDQVVVWSKAISDNVKGKYWNNGDGVSYPTD